MEKTVLISEAVLMLILFLLPHFQKKYKINRLRIFYVFPLLIASLLLALEGWGLHSGLLLAAALLQLIPLFWEKAASFAPLAGAALLVLCLILPAKERIPMAADFEKGFAEMKEYYVLTEEKEIDWDALYGKYKSRFEEADLQQDAIRYYQLWQEYCREFYDGHVSFRLSDDELMMRAMLVSYGEDYGLSLLRLTDGRYVAVNVEGCGESYSINDNTEDGIFDKDKGAYRAEGAEEKRLILQSAGIRNGTVITKWDGREVGEYFDEVDYFWGMQHPVAENEEFYLPLYVAGLKKDPAGGYSQYTTGEPGKASVEITFLDENGEERSVSAPSLGAYAPRLYDTMTRLDEGVLMTNLDWKRLSAETVLLRVSGMAYDLKSYSGVDYTHMSDKLREEILAYREEGVTNIIFDMRRNTGGSPFFVEAVAKLFAPCGEHLYGYTAALNEVTGKYERGEDGKYRKDKPYIYQGEDLWHDGRVILLVNAECVSAGDDMTLLMGGYPNVTVMGYTRTNSSCQAVGGPELESGSLSYSMVPDLDPEGEVIIDTRSDRVGRTPFDVRIPMDEEAVAAIFERGEDHALNYVVEGLE